MRATPSRSKHGFNPAAFRDLGPNADGNRNTKPIFDQRMFRHVNTTLAKERGSPSRVVTVIERAFGIGPLVVLVCVFERIATFVLGLPIPIYSSLVYAWVTNSRGLPWFGGMYLRGLYYRGKLGHMESNVFIDQGVFFGYPKAVSLSEFSDIDKNVIIMSKLVRVGRRVHIAPRVFVSGGGEFEIDDYACIATNSNIITSTEILKDDARCSGPMVSVEQRNVLRGRVCIEKDAFIGANVTILPGVTVAQGSVAGAGVTLAKSTAAWGIYVGPRAELRGQRDHVRWEDD
jgi:acetyltransferase-like isoleucine patch superfamily enzyme